jgi:hypothetical protein
MEHLVVGQAKESAKDLQVKNTREGNVWTKPTSTGSAREGLLCRERPADSRGQSWRRGRGQSRGGAKVTVRVGLFLKGESLAGTPE